MFRLKRIRILHASCHRNMWLPAWHHAINFSHIGCGGTNLMPEKLNELGKLADVSQPSGNRLANT
jgi:hypothetical protein